MYGMYMKAFECRDCESKSAMYVMKRKAAQLWDNTNMYRMCPKHAFDYVYPRKHVGLPTSVGSRWYVQPMLSMDEWVRRIKLPKSL